MRAGLSGQLEFSEGSHPVSAVYWLSCEEKFTPAVLEVQHCACVENSHAKTSHGDPVIHQWAKQPLMVKHHFELLCVYPLTQLSRKIMLYPVNGHHTMNILHS